ncbi:hypothetical protein FS837_009031 [Tulasnella sp. UAMH 9824]|nr:hypothetical protein FS837_009031 [Tulasnella sp. UAMH 9824]
MEVEPGLPSSNAALLPEPRQAPFEAQMNGELDAPVRAPSDTVMSDAEDVPCATGPIQQTESTSQTPFDLVSTTSVSSTLLDQDVDMEDAADSRSFTSLQQAPTSNGLDGPAPTLAQAATPSTTTTSSAAGPSTPTSSTSSHPTPEDVQPTATHAAHLHRVLGKWGLPKQASNPPPPAVPNEASKEAEVKSFFAMLKASRPPVQPQPKPTPSPSSSKPRQTKGEAARSLMDDLMAGFRSATKGKPSQQQVAMAVDPPAQSRPVLTTTATHVSFAVPPKLPRSTPVVAGRQPRPQPTPPHHVGTGSEATAPGGSMISPSEAPSTAGIPTIGKVNGPSSGSQVQVGFTSGAAVSGMASDTAMDGVESGRAIKGSRKAARAIARTGWTLETAQQKTREVQIAQDVEHNIEVAPPPASSLRAFEERVKSSAWHAAQPPPPPEAMAYIGVGKKIRRAA